MEYPAHIGPGICPHCGAPVIDGPLVGGIWTGGINSKAANGPLYATTCKRCEEELISMPTEEEAAVGNFVWELSSEFPGEKFVATMTADGEMPDFLRRIELFVQYLKGNGFDARCPSYTFAGILVPKEQAEAVRVFLNNAKIDYLKVWIAGDSGTPQKYIGS